jgi:hypothetical protein
MLWAMAEPNARQPDTHESVPGQVAAKLQADFTGLRAASLKERGVMIEAACRAASEIHRSRLRSGLADVQPAPWPESTLEFLRRHAPHGEK